VGRDLPRISALVWPQPWARAVARSFTTVAELL